MIITPQISLHDLSFQIVTFAAFSASFAWISAKAISSCLRINHLESETTNMMMIITMMMFMRMRSTYRARAGVSPP